MFTHAPPEGRSDAYYERYAASAAQAVAHLWEAPGFVHEYLRTLNRSYHWPAIRSHQMKNNEYSETSAWKAANEILNNFTRNPYQAALNTLQYVNEAIHSMDTQDDGDIESAAIINHLTLITNPAHLHQLAAAHQ